MSRSAPIFIGGLFKSGTSLLRAMLGQHPNIAAGLETYWFDLDWDARQSDEFAAKVERLRRYFDISPANMARIVDASAGVYDFLDSLMSEFARAQGKSRWCEKTPGNIYHLDRIVEGWPQAKIIHVVREPLDVLASIKEAKRHDWAAAFPDMWCRFVAGGIGQAKELGLDGGSYTEIRYESLILHPADTMKKVIAFIGEPWDPAVAQFSGRDDDFARVLAVTGKSSTTLARLREPLQDSRLGIWRSLVSSEEADALRGEIVRRGHGPLFDLIRSQNPENTA
ncbi:MAG TPA: sulfotransferase [Pseudolabrys sp.]|nr:sulfotransferase [Pseudolabrys sp.]